MLIAFGEDYTVEEIFSASYPEQNFWSGPRSAYHAVWADDFEKLLSHEERVIREVGELGHQRAIETRDKLVEEEHMEAVYGRH